MEVAILTPKTLKIKTKQGLIFVDPERQKNTLESDAALFLTVPTDFPKESYTQGLHVFGPGGFEVKGIKIGGTRIPEGIFYSISADGLTLAVGNASSLSKAKDKLNEHDAAVIFANQTIDEAATASLDAKILFFLGEKAAESAKTLGKEVESVNKFSFTKDKLPQETEIVVLA